MRAKRILVITSDKTFEEDLRNTIQSQSLPYNISFVLSLTEAMDKLNKPWFDLLILDASVSNNQKPIEELLNLNIPVIVTSGSDRQQFITEILNLGADNYLIRDPDKNYLKLLNKTLDLTIFKKNTEHILNKIETQYRAIYENNIAMYFTLDMDNRILSANSYASENLGYSKEELEGNLFSDIAHDDDRKDVIEQIDLCKKHPGQIFQWEFRLKRKDESYIFVKDNALTLEDKNPTTLFISCEDITVRKQAEESLKDWKNRYETAMEATSQILFDWDLDSNQVTLGGDLFETLGYSDSEIPSNFDEFLELIHTEDLDHFKDTIPKLKKSIRPFYIQFRLRRNDGDYIYAECNMRYIKGSENKQGRIIGFIEDVTLRRKMDDEILKSQRLESLGTLAGGIANDFNNLLTSIIGNISLIKRYITEDDKIFKKIMEVENASLRAKDLTQNLFIFSTGGSPVKSILKPAEVVRESVDFVLKGSKIKIEIKADDDLLDIFADKDQIIQVINNILVNADQSMNDGGKIQLFLSNVNLNDNNNLPLSQGKYVKISIEDEGSGISEENLPKIFDPYFTTKKTGSGLGLSTAHSIVINHKGYIDVYSKLDEGTRLDVYLPAFTDQSEDIIQKEVAQYDINMLSGKRVLVMDDEYLVRNVVGNILGHLNCDVDFATDGSEAVKIYKREFDMNQPYDYVILDLTVREGMGGLDCLEGLKKINPEVSAIVSSGYTKDPDVVNFKEYGFIGVINKPYEIEDFINSFHKIINNQ